MKSSVVALTLACLSLGSSSWGAELSDHVSCTSGKVERKIEVKRAVEGKATPCEVHYVKDADDKVIASFKNEDKCGEKVEALAKKLSDSGFKCENVK